jgi:hypothetical protein
MKPIAMFVSLIMIVVFSAGQAAAHANYTGYSGAPGARGTCTSSCHSENSFNPTITVTGFPTFYVPGQQYTIAVAHNGGGTISQFNCSIRIGTGSSNAGVLSAGTSTSIYNASGETNGVHFSSSSRNSGTFNWTAPAAGTGTVRFYWSGLQGSFSNGADTQIVLIGSENQTSIDDPPSMPSLMTLSQNYPNPFNGETIIEFTTAEPGLVDLEISNILGQKVFGWSDYISNPGKNVIHWNGKNNQGDEVPSGVYFYRLHTSQADLARRMIFLK